LRPVVVGIGGAGGKVLKQFLRSQDVGPAVNPFGEYLAFGDVRGYGSILRSRMLRKSNSMAASSRIAIQVI